MEQKPRQETIITEPIRFRWNAAILAGLIVGAWFLFFPRGIPWSSLTPFSAVVIGRLMPPEISLGSASMLHLLLSVCYALVIGAVVQKLRPELAILLGAATGGALYLLNWAVVYIFLDWWSGREFPVLIAHLLFGGFAAGAYRGLAARQRKVVQAVGP
jgi:hypothetical protein